MSNKSAYNIIGFTLSFILYIIVVASLIFYLQDNIKKNINYTTKKNIILDITLVQNKSDKPVKVKKNQIKKIKKTIKKKVASKPNVKKVDSKSPKKVSLQGLFKKIDTKKIVEPKKQKAIQSRKKVVAPKETPQEIVKKEDAKKLVESLNFENIQNISSSKDGIYDKFRGKVTEILNENWQKTVDTISGNKATVTIFVDNLGNFSYKIEKLSYNDEFNSKLIDFLEEMKNKKFPPFTEGGTFKIQVEFKDIR